MENQIEIAKDLEDFRKKAATEFIQEFMEIWQQQGFRLDDLIEAIAHYTYRFLKHQGQEQKNSELDVVVRKLEEAAEQYSDSQKYDQLLKDSSPN